MRTTTIIENEETVIVRTTPVQVGEVQLYNSLTKKYMIRVSEKNFTRLYNFDERLVSLFILPKKEVEELSSL